MSVLRIAGFCIASAMLVLLLRPLKPETAVAASIAAGVLLILCCLPALTQVVGALGDLARTGGLSDAFPAQLLKVAGVSLLMDFAAQTCRDAGEEGLAQRAELAGRILLLTLALPAMQGLLTRLMSLCA